MLQKSHTFFIEMLHCLYCRYQILIYLYTLLTIYQTKTKAMLWRYMYIDAYQSSNLTLSIPYRSAHLHTHYHLFQCINATSQPQWHHKIVSLFPLTYKLSHMFMSSNKWTNDRVKIFIFFSYEYLPATCTRRFMFFIGSHMS